MKCYSLIALLLFANISFAKEDLTVSLLSFNGAQRGAYLTLFEKFSAENPHINLLVNEYEAEKYKSEISDWLSTEKHSDIMYWFSGERLRSFVKQGLIKPIDKVWQTSGWDEQFTAGSQSSVMFQGKQYGLPIHYYPWAIYYKKSLFNRLGIEPPYNWSSFVLACEKLKSHNIAPIVLGTKNHWPLAAWFDYLNLRINGLEFHISLMGGEVSYKHESVRKVFQEWQNLVDRSYFYPNTRASPGVKHYLSCTGKEAG